MSSLTWSERSPVPEHAPAAHAPAIRIEDVGKQYRVGPHARVPDLLAERLSRAGRSVRARLGRHAAAAEAHHDDEAWMWALRHVTFDVREGETLGVVGRNGAGKSTLLKIIARVTTPTEGRVTTYGHVTSLLQVGTGFHQELSGRDNVFLNASLLRMNKRETQARFDEIVEFAGVERFIDTPVKHYSTGMRSRLAFAVAACLDPEILLLDEVLSVGDEEFRAKSFAKIRQLATSGRTVVFVSHALGQIKGICDRVILLERGNLEAEGNPDAVVTEYLDRLTQGEEQQAENDLLIAPDTERVGTADAQVVRVRLTDLEGRALGAVQFGRPFQVRITVHAKRRIKQGLCFEVGVAPAGGERFATAQSSDEGAPGPILDEGFHEVAVTVDTVLMPGDYSLDVGILRAQNGTVEDMIYDVLRFPAANGVKGEDRWPWPQSARGYTRLPAAWDEPTRVEAPPERPDG